MDIIRQSGRANIDFTQGQRSLRGIDCVVDGRARIHEKEMNKRGSRCTCEEGKGAVSGEKEKKEKTNQSGPEKSAKNGKEIKTNQKEKEKEQWNGASQNET